MKALRSVRNKRFHEAVFREHCLHQATQLGISIYEASRNGIYLQSIDAEGLVAVLNNTACMAMLELQGNEFLLREAV